ncbi:MAG: hypothetical protein IT231_12890 [Flavobacteriales bacterium]|nr:hypothetical protein [Flavobacteriales bacterium]HRT53545.1 hypothetical protein [Flavobacteriales bacterium]
MISSALGGALSHFLSRAPVEELLAIRPYARGRQDEQGRKLVMLAAVDTRVLYLGEWCEDCHAAALGPDHPDADTGNQVLRRTIDQPSSGE